MSQMIMSDYIISVLRHKFSKLIISFNLFYHSVTHLYDSFYFSFRNPFRLYGSHCHGISGCIIKFMLHHLSSILTYSLYSANGLYAGRMILSTFLSSSSRCALHPTIRAAAKSVYKAPAEDPAYYIPVRCKSPHWH